jgi:hypothetical protein
VDFKSGGYKVESEMITYFFGIGLPAIEIPILVNYNKYYYQSIFHFLS